MLKSKLLIGTSLVLLGSINAVNADPVNDCHMRDCTVEEKISANEYYIDIVGEAAVNNLQSIIEIRDDISTTNENFTNLETALEDAIENRIDGVDGKDGADGLDGKDADMTRVEANEDIINTLVDTEEEVDTGEVDDLSTDVDESKETIVNKGRVTVNEEAIASNTTDIHDVVDRISDAFEGLENATVNANLKQVDVNKAAIAHNASNIEANSARLDIVEGEIDNLKGGVAMAIAIANAPVISNGANKFSLSGGLGYYDEAIALSVKGAFMPTDSIAVTGSVASDLGENYSFGAGVGIAF